MNKEQVKTIEDLQSYLGGIPFEEQSFEYDSIPLDYYVFQDGTIAMDKTDENNGLLKYIAIRDYNDFWSNLQNDEWEEIIPVFNKISSLTEKAYTELMDQEAEDIVSDIESNSGYMDLVEMFDTTYGISGDKNSEIPDIDIDYGSFLEDYVVGGVLYYFRSDEPLQMIEDEEWEELDELSDEFDELVEKYQPKNSLRQLLLGLEDGYETSEKHYRHFLKPDENGNYSLDSLPSEKLNEPFSDIFFQFLTLLSDLQDPFLNQWALKNFSKFSTGQYQDYVSFDIDLPYENILQPLLKEKLMGKRQSDGTWIATENTEELLPFDLSRQELYDLHDSIQESLQSELDTGNNPAGVVVHFFENKDRFYISEYLYFDDFDIGEYFLEGAKKIHDGDLQGFFDYVLDSLVEWSYQDNEFEAVDYAMFGSSNDLYNTEIIGNFVIARPVEK